MKPPSVVLRGSTDASDWLCSRAASRSSRSRAWCARRATRPQHAAQPERSGRETRVPQSGRKGEPPNHKKFTCQLAEGRTGGRRCRGGGYSQGDRQRGRQGEAGRHHGGYSMYILYGGREGVGGAHQLVLGQRSEVRLGVARVPLAALHARARGRHRFPVPDRLSAVVPAPLRPLEPLLPAPPRPPVRQRVSASAPRPRTPRPGRALRPLQAHSGAGDGKRDETRPVSTGRRTRCVQLVREGEGGGGGGGGEGRAPPRGGPLWGGGGGGGALLACHPALTMSSASAADLRTKPASSSSSGVSAATTYCGVRGMSDAGW